MKKQINFIVPLAVYPFDVMCSFGESDDKLKSAIQKYGGKWNKVMMISENAKGRTVVLNGGQTLLRLFKYPIDCEDYGILAHEIFHAVDFLMRRINIKLTKKSDEAYAYLIGYLTEQIYKRL
jgi:hypothetical protein